MEKNMTKDNEKYLPIGTIALLKGGTKKVMIIGYKAVVTEKKEDGEKETEWDYSGCIYPEGMLSSDQLLLFDHSQISEIFFKGFEDEESNKFHETLKKL